VGGRVMEGRAQPARTAERGATNKIVQTVRHGDFVTAILRQKATPDCGSPTQARELPCARPATAKRRMLEMVDLGILVGQVPDVWLG
jgi:hypothetical protein